MRDQLKAKDSLGSNIMTYAIMSKHLDLFDTVFYSMRDILLDYEVRLQPPQRLSAIVSTRGLCLYVCYGGPAQPPDLKMIDLDFSYP